MRQFGLERGGTARLDEAVRVLALGQQHEAGPLGVGDDRQGRLECATRGLATGRIAVEREDHVIGGTQQRADMRTRDCGAERGDGFGEAGLRQLDDIEIALADDGTARLPDRIARLVQPVELLALAKHRRLGRIEVFRFAGAQDARTEADHLTARIADRKHDATAEAVVALAFVGDDEPGFDQSRIVVIGDRGAQRLPGVGRITQPEARRRLAGRDRAP